MTGSGRKENRISPEDGAHESKKSPVPLRLRECRSTPFLICYVVVAGGLISIAWYTFQNCYASYFLSGTDSWGNVCGGGPNTYPQVEGLEKYAQLKVEATSVWRQVCEEQAISICVKECPMVPLNSTSCYSLLEENAYGSNVIAQASCEDRCFTERQGSVVISIMNRCMRGKDLEAGYVFIPNYVNILHYAINDVISTLIAGGSIFAFVLVGSILSNVCIIKWPDYASIFHYSSSVIIAPLFCVFTAMSIYSRAFHVPMEFERAEYSIARFLTTSYMPVYVLLAIVSVISLTYIAYTLILARKHFRRARGLWLSTSRCMSANPQILSQPLFTLFTCAGATFFLSLLTFAIFGCHILTRSSKKDIAVLEDHSLYWLMIPAVLCYVWFVRLIGMGQSAVLSGAAADWYFTRRDHPLTQSLHAILKYNLGSLAAATFSGIILEMFLKLIPRKCARFPLISYFTSQVSISIGVYGEVREFCLEEKDCRDDNRKQIMRGYKLVQRSLFSWKIAVTEVSSFLFLISTRKTRLFIPIVPVTINALITWQLCSVFTACMEETMAGIAVCIYEDFKANNGKDKPYFCDRKVTHLLFERILPLNATHYGRKRIAKQEQRSKLIQEDVCKLVQHDHLVPKCINQTRQSSQELATSSHMPKSSRQSHVHMSKIQLGRSAIIKQASYLNHIHHREALDNENVSYHDSLSDFPIGIEPSSQEMSMPIQNIDSMEDASVITGMKESDESLNQSKESKSRFSGISEADEDRYAAQAPGKESLTVSQNVEQPTLATSANMRGVSTSNMPVTPSAKTLPSSLQQKRSERKMVHTVKDDDEGEEEWW